jgi:hypothetical protein
MMKGIYMNENLIKKDKRHENGQRLLQIELNMNENIGKVN